VNKCWLPKLADLLGRQNTASWVLGESRFRHVRPFSHRSDFLTVPGLFCQMTKSGDYISEIGMLRRLFSSCPKKPILKRTSGTSRTMVRTSADEVTLEN